MGIRELVKASPIGSALKRWRSRSQPWILNAEYDEQTKEVMRRTLRTDSCGIDIGAHTGEILRQMIEIAPRGRHFAFEPLPKLAAGLREAFPDVQVFEAAVSDRPGTSSFLHVENDPAYSGLRPRVYARPDPIVTPITVNVVTLDDVVPADRPVAFIKIDVEGGEYHAMLGGTKTIRRSHPVIVFEAGANSTGKYGVTAEELFRLVTLEFGYRLSTMRRWLDQASSYDEHEWRRTWRKGREFYFIAYPPV